jgi:predicted ATPase
MKILSLRLENYKSFRDSGWLEFSPGFTVVIGKNNSGKSALLEAFKLGANRNYPHRSLALPPETPLEQQSSADFELSISGNELRNALLGAGGDRHVPVATALDDAARKVAALALFEPSADISLRLRSLFMGSLIAVSYPSHQLFRNNANTTNTAVTVRGDRRTQAIIPMGVHSSDSDELPPLANYAYQKSIYVFRAERLNIGRSGASEASTLNPDGGNLAAVLATWQGASVNRFAKYNEHVTEILPTIRQVSVTMVANEVEVRVSQFDPKLDRDDLAIPLQDCGTGVGQVLAILFVAMTVRSGVIVIDEPNSFLHPGAAKKLIQILSRYDQHQYILASHSAELIATAKPSIVHLVKWENGESKVEKVDSTRVSDLRDILIEIGVSFSDLFGYDRAVWVEGPTEEICFPLILDKVLKRNELGLVFVAVRHTGDFEKKRDRKKLIWEIYEKLSSGALLLPTAVSFSFDREDRTEQDIDDLRRQSKGRAHFISRLTYENYLLIPEAIAALVNSLPREGKPTATPEQVMEWLKENGGKFGAKCNGDITNSDWLTNVHAPSLLNKLLNELASAGDNFEKTSHSKFLTQWLIDNHPAALAEIAEHIRILADETC